MRLPRGTREAVLALAAAGLVVLPMLFGGVNALRRLETASLDLRFRVRGALPPGNAVAIILADDASIAKFGRWPFSRRVFAATLDRLHEAGAKLIVFDLLFAEPERPIPPALRDAAAAIDGPAGDTARALVARLAADDPDAALAASIHAAGNVLLPVAFGFGAASAEEPAPLAASAYAAFGKSPVAPLFVLEPTSVLMPLPGLAAAALGLGHVELAYDVDGAPRYDYLALPFAGDFIPSLPVRAAAEYLGVPWSQVGLAPGAGVAIGGERVPTDRAMRMLIDYRGPRGTFPIYSLADFLAGKVPDAALSGRIVLIGASFTGNADSNAAPFDNTPMQGTERMANVIETILARDFIRESSPAILAGAAGLVMLLAALGGGTAALLPTRLAFLAGVAPIALWLAAAQGAFARHLWLPVVYPVAALIAATAAALLFRYWVVDREGRMVKTAFRHYLAPDMVNLVAAHPERLKLGGETRELTMLFCDVRGFTAISESYKDNPQGLTRLINRFLTPMTDIIMARGGTIDKYMGDCIMAFWNAPLADARHADHACASALAMLGALDDLNAALAAEARAAGVEFRPLKIGIGLNSGACVVGNMGSDQRFDYSVLGDAVNLASRLEGQSKTYGVASVIGEATRAAAPHWAALELDLLAVKGKAEAVRIYALMGDAAMAASAPFAARAARQSELLKRYRAQDWAAAREMLELCRAADPPLGALFDLYAERIAAYEATPPGADWDGSYVAETK